MKHLIYLLFFISVIKTVLCNIREKRQDRTAAERSQSAGFALGQALGGTVNNLLGGLLGVGGSNKKNGCNINNGGCEQGCTEVQSRVHCYCFSGFVLKRDQRTCTDINECSLGPQKVCEDKCVNTLGSYFCSCSSGVLLDDGKSCNQVSSPSCSDNNGGCEQDCITNGNGHITCKCSKGFVLADDKKTCYDIDECSKGKKCRPESTCINTVGGYICSLDGITSCRDKNGGCDHSCRETKRGIICRCNKGFQLHKNGKSCFLSNGYPEPDDLCQNGNGGCEQICINDGGFVKCECREGFVIANGRCIG